MENDSLIGSRFGKLVVEGLSPKPVGDKRKWVWVHCDCGNRVSKPLGRLKNKHIKSCGCLKKQSPAATKPETMIGKRFNRLLVIRQLPTRFNRTRWECLCDCGNYAEVTAKFLKSGHTKSCGCILREWGKSETNRKRHRGIRPANWKGIGDMSGSHWKRICWGAKIRKLDISITHQDCVNLFESQKGKCALTGQTIKFTDMGDNSKTSGTASLDRIDNTKGYVPGNVQWVDKHIQKMKSDLPQEEFIQWCQKIAEHTKKEND